MRYAYNLSGGVVFSDNLPENIDPKDVVELEDNFVCDARLDYSVFDGKLYSTIHLMEPRPALEVAETKLQAALERQEFLEDCLAELINKVYSE